jgi:hypothetical protein
MPHSGSFSEQIAAGQIRRQEKFLSRYDSPAKSSNGAGSFLQMSKGVFACREERLPEIASAQFARAQQELSELMETKVFLDQNVCGGSAYHSGALVAAALGAYIL